VGLRLLRGPRYVASVILLLLIVVATYATGESRQDRPASGRAAQATGRDQRPAEPQASTPQGQPTAIRPNTDEYTRPENGELPSRWGVAEWSAIAQAFSAVVVMFFTGFLVWYSHRGWTIAKESADASRLAADAAKESAEVAQRSLVLLNRPWLDTANWAVERRMGRLAQDSLGGDITPIEGLTITFDVVNNSPTPARINWINTEDDITQTGSSSAVETVLTPNGQCPYSHELYPLTDEQISQYKNRGLVVLLRGFIHYGDLFAPRQPKSPAHGFGPRVRRFGRSCVLRHGHGSTFTLLTGAEGVGMNDEDWEREQNEGQPND
jgi:hypothetical protein